MSHIILIAEDGIKAQLSILNSFILPVRRPMCSVPAELRQGSAHEVNKLWGLSTITLMILLRLNMNIFPFLSLKLSMSIFPFTREKYRPPLCLYDGNTLRRLKKKKKFPTNGYIGLPLLSATSKQFHTSPTLPPYTHHPHLTYTEHRVNCMMCTVLMHCTMISCELCCTVG